MSYYLSRFELEEARYLRNEKFLPTKKLQEGLDAKPQI